MSQFEFNMHRSDESMTLCGPCFSFTVRNMFARVLGLALSLCLSPYFLGVTVCETWHLSQS